MVIFLSIGLVAKVEEALLAGGAYTADTRRRWSIRPPGRSSRVVRCTVGSLAESTKAAGITKTALIVVGDFLGTQYERSKLYDPTFATEYRPATGAKAMSRAYLAFTEKRHGSGPPAGPGTARRRFPLRCGRRPAGGVD